MRDRNIWNVRTARNRGVYFKFTTGLCETTPLMMFKEGWLFHTIIPPSRRQRTCRTVFRNQDRFLSSDTKRNESSSMQWETSHAEGNITREQWPGAPPVACIHCRYKACNRRKTFRRNTKLITMGSSATFFFILSVEKRNFCDTFTLTRCWKYWQNIKVH